MRNVKIFKRKLSITKLLLASLMLITINSCNSNERKVKKQIKNYCLEQDNIEVYNIKINKMEPMYINDYTETQEYKTIEEEYNDIISKLTYCENTIEIMTEYINKTRSVYNHCYEEDDELDEIYDSYDYYMVARDNCIKKINDIKDNFEPYLLGYNMTGRCKAKLSTGVGYVGLYVLFNPEMTEILSLDVDF